MNATLTPCMSAAGPCYRINHPQTNAALTRSDGKASPRLMGRLKKVLPSDYVGARFKKGLKSNHWYVLPTR